MSNLVLIMLAGILICCLTGGVMLIRKASWMSLSPNVQLWVKLEFLLLETTAATSQRAGLVKEAVCELLGPQLQSEALGFLRGL